MRRAVLIIFLPAAAVLAQTIEGSVTSSVGNTPVPGVKVTIEAARQPVRETTTGAQGSFRVADLPPGDYTAAFSKPGFDMDRGGAIRRTFHLTAAGTVRLDVTLTPLARISGRVLDAAGNPVSAAQVWIFGGREGYSGATNAQGSFSIEGVLPGSYRLLALPPRALKPPPDRDGRPMGWLPTFFPAVPDAASATRVFAAPGAELWDQEIRLQSAPVHYLRGVVLDTAGHPAAHVTVSLGAAHEILMNEQDRHITAVSAADGAFEFPAVADGEWRLTAEAERDGQKLQAFLPAVVSGADVEGLRLRLQPPFTLSGTVVRVAPAGVTIPRKTVLVLLAPAVGGGGARTAKVDADDTFHIDDVYPGLYTVRSVSPDPPFYLASVQLGERDVLGNDPVEISSAALPLTITYRADGGTVRGTVENCGSATVVLVPQEPRLRIPDFMRNTACGGAGRFEIPNVRPGEYYGFAFDRAPGIEDIFFGFNVDQGLINRAALVTVRPSESTAVELKVTARP